MKSHIRIGVLISGTGSNLNAINKACDSGKIAGAVVFVGSDKPDAAGLSMAAQRGIPTFAVDYRAFMHPASPPSADPLPPADLDLEAIAAKQHLFSSDGNPDHVNTFLKQRVTAEAAMLTHMRAFPFDLLVLAGFMRTLTPYFIDRVNRDAHLPRIMNIHPALLPAFPGVDGYGDTYRYGCKVGGCTVHFVDYGEDTGPIIGQRAFEISPSDTLDDIRNKGLRMEWELYPECIRLYAQGRLSIERQVHFLPNGKRYHRNVVVINPA